MRREFVKTENDKRFRTAVEQRAQAAAAESHLLVVNGRAGDGKTTTLLNWASAVDGVLLTGNPSWTPRRMLIELAGKLGIVTKGDWEGALAAQIAADETAIVVDEAGFALRDNAVCLESLRSITDKSGTLLVLVVMERDMARLRQFDQITSRATLCPFHASTLADVTAACAQLAEVAIEPDLAERIWRDSGARMRLVVECINTVERVATAAGKAAVCAADLKSFALCEDFNRSKPAPRSQRGV
jgi:DNA transposition AAA+ family ATPase